MKEQLILVISDRMESNKKPDRNEDKLIRLGSKVRDSFGLTDESEVELWPNTTAKDRINRSRMLKVFHAFKSDIKKLRDQGMPEEDILRVGFVTRRTFDRLCPYNVDPKSDIHIATSIEDTFLGSDPEFILLDDEDVPMYAGYVDGLSREGKLGHDGPLAEIRPDPAISIEDFVDKIYEVLSNDPAKEYIKNYKWIAGCHFESENPRADRRHWPIGGHIHVGMPLRLKNLSYSHDGLTHFGKSTFITLVRILDEFVAIPTIKLDTKKWTVKRRNHPIHGILYGRFGDYRTKHQRLEYRTLSGNWFAHPELTKMVVGTVKCIVDSYYKFIEGHNFDISQIVHPNFVWDSTTFTSFDEWDKIPVMQEFGCLDGSTKLSAIMNDGDVRFGKAYFNSLKERFKTLSAFPVYSDYVEKFIDTMSLSTPKLSRIERDVRINWIEKADLGI